MNFLNLLITLTLLSANLNPITMTDASEVPTIETNHLEATLTTFIHQEGAVANGAVSLDICSDDKDYFLTISPVYLVSTSPDYMEVEMIKLDELSLEYFAGYAYNTHTKQLLVQTHTPDNEIQLYAYDLNGEYQWTASFYDNDTFSEEYMQVGSNNLVAFGENWAYIDGSEVEIVDKNWSVITSVKLPEGKFMLSDISEDFIYLREISSGGEVFSVVLDHEGTLINREISENYYSALTLSESDDTKTQIVRTNKSGGEICLFETDNFGVSKLSKTYDFSRSRDFYPMDFVELNGKYYIFGSITNLDNYAETGVLNESILCVILDENFELSDTIFIDLENRKNPIDVKTDDESISLVTVPEYIYEDDFYMEVFEIVP